MNIDELIKSSLSDRMIKIDDPRFTKTIVDKASETMFTVKPMPFTGFASLIAGMVFLITSAGTLLLDFYHKLPAELEKFNPDTGVILVALAIAFLLYTVLTEVSIKWISNKLSH